MEDKSLLEDIGRKGREIYESQVRPHIDDVKEKGKFVAIDIHSRDYEIDAEQLTAGRRLRKRHDNAIIYFTRIGLGYAHHLSARPI